jgi:crotonyl-CoA carboxylase/reductase
MNGTNRSTSVGFYELGSVPELGVIPPNMLAQVIRAERFGEPRDAFQSEVVPTPSLGPRDVLI